MWEVQVDGHVRRLDVKRLRRQLERGELSGVELARPEGGAWAPLHQTALFREVVPHTGDARRAALARLAGGVFAHIATFLAVMVFLGFPSWGIWWALAIVIQVAKSAGSWGALMATAAPSVAPALPVPETPVLPAPPPAAETSGPLAQALEALVRAADRAEVALGERVDLKALREAASDLERRKQQLGDVVDTLARRKLDRERAALVAKLETLEDPRDREVAERELGTLEDRLEGMDEAAAALERVLSRERALLNQVEALRLQVARSSADEGLPSGVDESLRELAREAKAAAEVDAALARGRIAGRRTTS